MVSIVLALSLTLSLSLPPFRSLIHFTHTHSIKMERFCEAHTHDDVGHIKNDNNDDNVLGISFFVPRFSKALEE